MKQLHSTVLNTLTRVQRFLDNNAQALGDIPKSGARATLDDVVTALSSHAVSQTGSKRAVSAEAVKQRVLRNSLKKNHMRPIATVAAAELQQVPEFTQLKMPSAKATSRELIAAAGAMGKAAAQYSKTFIDTGLPKDFVEQLQAAADALDKSITNQGSTKTKQTGATAGLNAEVKRGRETVKVLDALVEPAIAGNAPLLVQWKAVRKFSGKSTIIPSTTIDAASKGAVGATTPDPASAANPGVSTSTGSSAGSTSSTSASSGAVGSTSDTRTAASAPAPASTAAPSATPAPSSAPTPTTTPAPSAGHSA